MIYQFTSTYVAGGLDGNMDLTGITDNGYTAQPAPAPDPTPAPTPTPSKDEYQSANGTYTFKVNTKIRNGVGVTGQDSGLVYEAGGTVIYDRIYKNVDGYDWLSYVSYSGQRRFVAMIAGSTSAPSTPAPTAPKRVAQTGTYRARSTMNVRTSPSTSAAVVATYSPGQTFTYDSYVDADGIRWVSYISHSGQRRYVARWTLDNSTIYGDCY